MPVTLDNSATGNNGAGATTVVSASLTTGGENRLLLATVSVRNNTSQTVTSISGGGLTWVLIDAINASNGPTRCEVWRAFAPSALNAVVITANLSASTRASIVISAYSGVNSQGFGTDGGGAIGATAKFGASISSSAPSLAVTTIFTNSLVTGHLCAGLATSVTAGSGQSINQQDAATTDPACAQSRQNSVTSAAGTSVTTDYSLTASVSYSLIVIEIVSDGIQVSNAVLSSGLANQSKSTGTTLALAGPFPQAAYHSAIICFAMDDDGASPGTVSCDRGFVKDVDVTAGGSGTGCRVVIFSALNLGSTGLTGVSVTITHPSVTARAAALFIVAGVDKLDQTGGTTGSSASPSSGVTTTRSRANELLIGAIASEGPGQTADDTFTAGMGFTKLTSTGMTATVGTTGGGAASNISLLMEFKVVTATGTDAATATITSRDWACAIATYFKDLMPSQLLSVDSVTNVSDDLRQDLPSAYKVNSTIADIASTVVSIVYRSRTAEGEVPQQHAVSESNGGDETAQVVIPPGIQVDARVQVGGAAATVALSGVLSP
jgi:hypothetical protein